MFVVYGKGKTWILTWKNFLVHSKWKNLKAIMQTMGMYTFQCLGGLQAREVEWAMSALLWARLVWFSVIWRCQSVFSENSIVFSFFCWYAHISQRKYGNYIDLPCQCVCRLRILGTLNDCHSILAFKLFYLFFPLCNIIASKLYLGQDAPPGHNVVPEPSTDRYNSKLLHAHFYSQF